MQVIYFVKVGKSDLVIHVTIVIAKNIKHEINFSFSMPKKIRHWQPCSNVYHSSQNAKYTKLPGRLKLANIEITDNQVYAIGSLKQKNDSQYFC